MFLIRTAFWLSVVILLLPAERATDGADGQQSNTQISASEVFSAARATLSDVSSICERSPEVCVAGRAAAETFTNKARYGAQLLMDYVAEEGATAPATSPASVPPSNAAFPAPASNAAIPAPSSQNTLSQRDLQPGWEGPGNNA